MADGTKDSEGLGEVGGFSLWRVEDGAGRVQTHPHHLAL